jgi:xylan 1,4-beta-xylosidase
VTPAGVDLVIDRLPDGPVMVEHAPVGADHSNAYDAWKRMGAPQAPTPEHYAQLERAGQLAEIAAPQRLEASAGRVRLTFTLPRQGVSLVTIAW